jgi:HSP20 family protein
MLDLVPFGRRHELPDIFREMEKAVKNIWHEFPFGETISALDLEWTPRLDLIESEAAYEVKTELPGMAKKDIDISLDRDVLVIKGEKKSEKEESGKHYHRREGRYGTFYRSIRLPGEVKEDNIDAAFKDGILTITLPKTEETKKRIAHIKVH